MLICPTNLVRLKLDAEKTINTSGLLCKMIDFTFSRMKTNKNEVICCDLEKEEWLFQGDETISPQYEIYRKMRDITKGNWTDFKPETNILWLTYLAQYLGERCEPFKPEALEHIKRFKECDSVSQFEKKFSFKHI